MEIALLTQTKTVIDVATKLRPLLHQGKDPNTISKIYSILDDSHVQTEYNLVRHVINLIKGDASAVEKFMDAQATLDNPQEFYHAYGQLLVDVAIYKLLARDSHADVAEAALQGAAHCFYSYGDGLHMVVFIEIIELAAVGKINDARALHQQMTQTWLTTRSEVALQWKLVLDMAMLRATGDTKFLHEIHHSPGATRQIRHQASELHRKLQAKSWFTRQVHGLRSIMGYSPRSTAL